jgi:hypothetical protein
MSTKRVPGTVRGDVADDRKGDPTRGVPYQPDLYVENEDDDGDEAEAEQEKDPKTETPRD